MEAKMEYGRLPWLAPSELNDAQRRVYKLLTEGPRANGRGMTDPEGRLYGPFNAMLLDPVVGEWLQGLGAALRFETEISARQREIAILCAAQSMQSSYEFDGHARLGSSAGLTDAQIDALAAGSAPDGLEPQDAMVWRVARAITDSGDLDDQLFEEAVAALGRVAVMDVIVLIGYYRMIAPVLKVWRVPLRDGVVARFPD
jgi:4-carboxymuconolactone decarboxylase